MSSRMLNTTEVVVVSLMTMIDFVFLDYHDSNNNGDVIKPVQDLRIF